MKRHRRELRIVLLWVGMLAWSAVAPPAEAGQRCRIVKMDDRVIEGEVVEETPEGYRIRVRGGITMLVHRHEVRRVEALGSAEASAPVGGAPEPAGIRLGPAALVSDADIRTILGPEPDLKLSDIEAGAVDMEAPLETDRASLDQMIRLAGGEKVAKTLETDHFVFVYTSPREDAMRLAARLESIYRWNVRFMEMCGLAPRRPEFRLEIFFFGTFKEYEGYMSNMGWLERDALGFYMPGNNRSAFFDVRDYPPFAQLVKELKEAKVDGRRRQAITNRINRRADHFNLTVVQHEAAHHIHFNIGVFPRRADIPRWMGEGLAQMFEVPPSEAGAALGTTNHYRLYEFRSVYGGDPDNREMKRLPIDLRLFIVDDREWKGGQSYSMGWALNHYLWKKHRQGYARWMQRLSQLEEDSQFSPTDRQAAFEDALGVPIDEQFEKDFLEFMNSIALKKSVIPD